MRRSVLAAPAAPGLGGAARAQDAPASAIGSQEPRGSSSQGLMQRIMENGATVEACAICLPNRGEGPEVRLDGITPADPPDC